MSYAVTFAQIPRWWRVTLANGVGDPVTRVGVIAATAFAGAAFLWPLIAGSGASSNALLEIQHHMESIDKKMEDFQNRLDNGVRLDQLGTIDRHLSAQDGRMDGIDNRINDLVNRTAHAESRLDGIDHASQAHLKDGR